MKKILMCLTICMILFITGCGKKLSGYTEISYQEYVSKIETGDTFPLVIGSATCSACNMFKPIMESFISKYQVEVFYIDISTLSEDDYNLLNSEINFSSTPTTVFIKDGKQTSVYYRIVGSETLSGVVNAYTKMGYIEGE